MLPDLLVDGKTKDKLGTDGLNAVMACLWLRDCQTCSRKLGPGPTTLCIDDLGTWASATLHHPRCRPAGWNDDSAVAIPSGANTTWTSVSFMLPSFTGLASDPRPAVLVNPSLEMVFLEPCQDGWMPAYQRVFTSLGMVQPGRKLRLDRPLRGLSAWVANDFISVTVAGPAETIYEATAPAEVTERARKLRRLLFMVTHAIDPAELYADSASAGRHLHHLLESGQLIIGCAAVSDS